MTQITKEAIEAACEAQAIAVAKQDGVVLTTAGFRHGATARPHDHEQMREYVAAGLEAALPFLPIAVEGKAEPRVRHKKRGTEYAVITTSARLQASGKLEDNEVMVVYRGEDGQIWCRPEYEFSDGRFEYISSSPGKDGGQEVDLRRPLQMCVDMLKSNGFGVASVVEVAERALAASSQPASTALVERLTSALLKAEEVLANYADPTGYTDGYGDPVPADAVQHEGLLAQEALDIVRSALSASQSTSTEGESRG